jgi:rubrerythrin
VKHWKCSVCGYTHEDKYPPDVCPVCGAGKYRFILDDPVPENLKAQLKKALAGESKAFIRNLAFARQADREGFPQVARLFRAVAEAEKVHASEYLHYLEGYIGTTEENLKKAFENETRAAVREYAPMIKEALALKREDVAWSLIRARDVEDRHAKLYKAMLSAMAVDRDLTYHVCQVCGYVFDALLPEACPVCLAHPREFKPID